MAADHERAVQLLNDVKLSSDATEKVRTTIPILMQAPQAITACAAAIHLTPATFSLPLQVNLLKSLQEIVIKKEPSLIPTFLPEVLELQVDPAPAVRRQVLDLFDAAVQARPDASLLEQGLRCITYLLQDSVPATVKRAVVSSYPTYRAALAYVVAHGSGAAGVQGLAELWQTATGVRSAITTLATASTTNSGVKLSASKFIEQGVMLHTADVVPAVAGILPAPQPFPANNPVVSKAALVKDGEQLLGSLAVMLKNTADQEETGPLAIACIRTGMTIIQQRPQFIGRVLPLLLPLTKIAKFKASRGTINLSCVCVEPGDELGVHVATLAS